MKLPGFCRMRFAPGGVPKLPARTSTNNWKRNLGYKTARRICSGPFYFVDARTKTATRTSLLISPATSYSAAEPPIEPLKDIQVLVWTVDGWSDPELALVGEEGAAEPYRLSDEKPAFPRLMATQHGWQRAWTEKNRCQTRRLWATIKRRIRGTALRFATSHFGRAVHGSRRQRRSALDTLRRVKCFGAPPDTYWYPSGEHASYRKHWRVDPPPVSATTKSWSKPTNRRFLIRRTELQTSASAAQLATKRRNARSARYLPVIARSTARLHCRLRDLDGETTVALALAPPCRWKKWVSGLDDAGCSAVWNPRWSWTTPTMSWPSCWILTGIAAWLGKQMVIRHT